MRSSVFIKTWNGDIQWIPWVLRFLKKNWLTDSEFLISAPGDCTDTLKAMRDILGKPIIVLPIEQWGDNPEIPRRGWVHQQFVKHQADLYCQGDYISFIDSDCILVKPTDFDQHLMVGDKPVMWYTEYDKIHTPWRGWVTRILGMEPPYEFMRCFPLTYHKSTLALCRAHLETFHAHSLNDIMYGARCWTEFNILGFYAYVFQRDLYEWKNTYDHPMYEQEIYRHDRVRQFHNVYDWNAGTEPYLKEMYGEPIEDSGIDLEKMRVVKTPPKAQQALVDRILEYIRPNSYTIDVGAHEGLHSVAYANAGAIVLSFEPNPASFTKLWRTMFALGKRESVYPLAVSDTTGTVQFHVDKDVPEASHVSTEGEEIPCVDLDTFCESMFESDGLSVIKIDVEGLEPKVLQGARRLIEKYRPVLVVECQRHSLERNGFSKNDIDSFLKELDYNIEISTTDPRSSTSEEDFFCDYICTPNRRDARTDPGGDLGHQGRNPFKSLGQGDWEIGSRPGPDPVSAELHQAGLDSH